MNKVKLYFKKLYQWFNIDHGTRYKQNLILALFMHLGILAVLVVNFTPNKIIVTASKSAEPKKIVNAGLVDKKIIDAAVKRQKEKTSKQKKELESQKRQAQQAKKQLAEAQKKAKQAKLDTDKAKQELNKEKQKLAEQKRKVAAEKKQREEQEQKEQLVAHKRWIDQEFSRIAADIQQAIYEQRTVMASFSDDLVCEVQVKLLSDGSVKAAKVIKSSGNNAYDTHSKLAVNKAAPFNMPTDPELLRRLADIVLVFRKDQEYG